MAIERREILGGTPRIGWLWGFLLVLLVAAVVVLGVAVPTGVALLLGANAAWSAAVMVAGFLIAGTAFVAILRLGRRHAWRG